MSIEKFVIYYRVSTTRQNESGLGLEAQKSAALGFVESSDGKIVQVFTEVESGKKKNRPELSKALAACQKTGATLLIAKLDRLARNVAVIANLLESGVKFVAVDMPNADRFVLHIMAAVAEHEAHAISERTKAALTAAKARGTQLGKNGKNLARQNKQKAKEFAQSMHQPLHDMLVLEQLSFSATAERLNQLKIPTARGGKWHSTTVFRTWQRVLAGDRSITHAVCLESVMS